MLWEEHSEHLYIISYIQQLRICHLVCMYIGVFNFSEVYEVRMIFILKSFSMHVLRIRTYTTTIPLSHVGNLFFFLILSNIQFIFKFPQFFTNGIFKFAVTCHTVSFIMSLMTTLYSIVCMIYNLLISFLYSTFYDLKQCIPVHSSHLLNKCWMNERSREIS